MTCIADFLSLFYTLCVSVSVICEPLCCALFKVLADSVFYWELIFNRNNITFQMTSNDVDFFSFQ